MQTAMVIENFNPEDHVPGCSGPWIVLDPISSCFYVWEHRMWRQQCISENTNTQSSVVSTDGSVTVTPDLTDPTSPIFDLSIVDCCPSVVAGVNVSVTVDNTDPSAPIYTVNSTDTDTVTSLVSTDSSVTITPDLSDPTAPVYDLSVSGCCPTVSSSDALLVVTPDATDPNAIDYSLSLNLCAAPAGAILAAGDSVLACVNGNIVQRPLPPVSDPCAAALTGALVTGDEILICTAAGLEKKTYTAPPPAADPCAAILNGALVDGDEILVCSPTGLIKRTYSAPGSSANDTSVFTVPAGTTTFTHNSGAAGAPDIVVDICERVGNMPAGNFVCGDRNVTIAADGSCKLVEVHSDINPVSDSVTMTTVAAPAITLPFDDTQNVAIDVTGEPGYCASDTHALIKVRARARIDNVTANGVNVLLGVWWMYSDGVPIVLADVNVDADAGNNNDSDSTDNDSQLVLVPLVAGVATLQRRIVYNSLSGSSTGPSTLHQYGVVATLRRR